MHPDNDLPGHLGPRADHLNGDRSAALHSSTPTPEGPPISPVPTPQLAKTHYIFVDLENVQPKITINPAVRSVKLKIFVGTKQDKVPLDLVLAAQAYGPDAEYIQVDGQAENALDFYITYYIGQLVGSMGGQVSDVCFHIISKDRGFDPLIAHLKAKNIFCHRSTSFAAIPFDGIKHEQPNPWDNVDVRYLPGMQIEGVVRKLANYGAIIEIEEGINGLMHISAMNWVRKISHPSEVLRKGEKVTCVIVSVDWERKRIALSLKKMTTDPWDRMAERYLPGTHIEGVVRNLTNYGAFIEIEEGIDGLLHVSDMSWVRKVGHPSDMMTKGEKVKCVILSVDQESKRVALGLKQMAKDPWEGDIPGRYHPGDIKKGKVTKLTNFGVFVELEQGLEGLLHLSELADQKVDSPEGVVKVGDEIEVKVLNVNAADRKIGLSRKRLNEPVVSEEAAATPESGETSPVEKPDCEERKSVTAKAENPDKVQAIIHNLAKQKGKPSTLKALHGTIKTLFANRLTVEEVQSLVDQLVLRGKLTVSQNKVCYGSNPSPIMAQAGQKKSPTPSQKPGPFPKVKDVVAKLKPQKNKPNTVKALGSTINSYFGMKLTEAEIANLIGQLKQCGFIKVSQNKVAYHLSS